VAFSPLPWWVTFGNSPQFTLAPYSIAELSCRRTQSLVASHQVKICLVKRPLIDLQVHAIVPPPLDTRDRLFYHPSQTPGFGCQVRKLRTKPALDSPLELALTWPIVCLRARVSCPERQKIITSHPARMLLIQLHPHRHGRTFVAILFQCPRVAVFYHKSRTATS
jgi:hypothetical protein